VLDRPVHVPGGDKPFGELTRQEVADRARELKEATGWGPMMRVAPVARAWAELARAMDAVQADSVADLDAETLEALAEPLWISPNL
jgi:hypothetical protein